jgi:hypothetical protein
LKRQGRQERQGIQKELLTAEAQRTRRRPKSKSNFDFDFIELLCDLRALRLIRIFLGVPAAADSQLGGLAVQLLWF